MKIMVIDNHLLFREGIAGLLGSQPDMEVVGQFDLSVEAVKRAVELEPEIILMDTSFLHAEGIRIMKQILSERPAISFLILNTQDSDEQFYEMIGSGAKGYLPKNASKQMLLAALRALDKGEAVIPRNLVTKVLQEFARLGKLVSEKRQDRDFSLLTNRELEILKILGIRATNREIAVQLGISENTVRVHVGRILEKLRLRNRREASEFARRWVELSDPRNEKARDADAILPLHP